MIKKDIKKDTNIINLSKAKLIEQELFRDVDSSDDEGLVEKYRELYGFRKWRDIGYDFNISVRSCSHFGEMNIFGLVPISCYDIDVNKINKLIIEKNIKSWLILDLSCLSGVDIDKLSDVNIYFERIEDFSVPSFKEMNNIIEFISDNTIMDSGNTMVSCIAGHGRTGLVLSVWAGINGISNPVKYVRDNYCKKAVESVTQEMFVNLYLNYINKL